VPLSCDGKAFNAQSNQNEETWWNHMASLSNFKDKVNVHDML
jgi:hypothetical protein